MRALILGGTQFVGRHIAEALVAGGHRVTVFNRGQTPDELPECVDRLRGDRVADTRSWMAGREMPAPAMTPQRDAELIGMTRGG
jgi:nucleoside-diphosphate-sugar epimerase